MPRKYHGLVSEIAKEKNISEEEVELILLDQILTELGIYERAKKRVEKYIDDAKKEQK
jgi:hypothetical protein